MRRGERETIRRYGEWETERDTWDDELDDEERSTGEERFDEGE